ncbi:TetR/AcrR family transcriptional regulator [Streptomonospora nanhaiensis]|uniref:AcrR family transcriptional regulator n=1 Tax=Streptomonospora nanhaiensis TaxID=1323731 RepID=A0A853BTV6_9ACTN|nr:TetR/AcrR family transcriptional regulator [Streptomonospora nanhaiensis]MBV2363702.1 TetR/AcrR family transcriptional regulator [Streptomonospora nanhaiensis]MBX9387708.1 TetR/AcrR family transcriptional regulator [Streptomonospora nanhaiensis]MBX9390876.1 TetR/AcrR family transcriptional regulator [Streptomonospora nanhaiensis]NYI98748.1 AcrR family transcriptional regulator [Streptomonospora nanhaiensis]
MTADLSHIDARAFDRALHTAAGLFARHGLNGIGMAAIAHEVTAATGVDPVAFRRTFPTRLDLAYAVALHSTRDLVDAQLGSPADGLSPTERVDRLVRRHIRHCWRQRTAEHLRRALLPTLRAIHPERHRELTGLLQGYRAHLRALIAEGVAAGEFRVANPVSAAATVVDTLDSVLDWYDPEGGLTLAELGDVNADLVIHHHLGRPRE